MRNPKQSMAALLMSSLICTTSFAQALKTQVAVSSVNINAEEILASSGDLRNDITRALADERIESELQKLGITKSEVELRLAAMSDAELKQIQQGAERQVGGEVIIIGLTTILLIIIIYLLVRR